MKKITLKKGENGNLKEIIEESEHTIVTRKPSFDERMMFEALGDDEKFIEWLKEPKPKIIVYPTKNLFAHIVDENELNKAAKKLRKDLEDRFRAHFGKISLEHILKELKEELKELQVKIYEKEPEDVIRGVVEEGVNRRIKEFVKWHHAARKEELRKKRRPDYLIP